MENIEKPRIKILAPGEARRIAAGEVIDRPAALIREFLDNAIDSGAASVEVAIEGGGGKKAEVIDDGQGMGREDLELCWLTHATSKISCLDDLATATTLGFRGEALAAAAAVAKLEITSSVDGREAWLLEAGPGAAEPRLTRTRRTKGSTVRALGLFDTIPARKRFLKRDSSEAALCRQAFIDKALAFTDITFRFTQDGKAKDYLPKAASKKERFGAALLTGGESGFLHEIHTQGTGFSVDVVIGGPELARNDKRMLYVFANGRRIQDYALTQALVFGTQGWFPNGTFPIGAAYIDIDPALADFNIHPAKREVRFRDAGAIHSAITQALRDFCHHRAIQTSLRETPGQPLYTGEGTGAGHSYTGISHADYRPAGNALAMEALLENPPAFAPLPGRERENETAAEAGPAYYSGMAEPRYIGRVFDLFLLAEWRGRLYIIDQHAAHERILYNRFITGDIPRQELLVPITFTSESDDDDRFIESQKDQLADLGILIRQDGKSWLIEALPAGWRMSDAETIHEILELGKAGENMAIRWAATLCCHLAIRDGDYLDEKSAQALTKEALALPEPRCPHGRPVYTEIAREALLKAVKRT